MQVEIKHKYAAVLAAFINGETVQYRNDPMYDWVDYDQGRAGKVLPSNLWQFNDDSQQEWRLKPKETVDIRVLVESQKHGSHSGSVSFPDLAVLKEAIRSYNNDNISRSRYVKNTYIDGVIQKMEICNF